MLDATAMTKDWTMDQIILAPGSASLLIAHYRRREQELLEANDRYLERARAAEATARDPKLFRHRKGGTYEVIGVGKMQAQNWMVREFCAADEPVNGASVDMAEVTIYRSTEDGSLWVRPVEEFNDGRFEPTSSTPPPSTHVEAPDFLHRLVENAFSWGKQDCNYLNPKHINAFIASTRKGMPPEAAAAWIASGSHASVSNVAMAKHPDDIAVDRFASAMKAKLAKKRDEGKSGWEDKDECSQLFLSQLLREHVEKGDPVDVGNLAMMLHQREERISSLLEALQGE